MRNLNRLLSLNDIDIKRLENNVLTGRKRAADKKKEERVQTLWNQISGPNPSMSVQYFLTQIANLKTSKHTIQSEDEGTDSEQSDHDGEVDSEAETDGDVQPAQPQGQMKCNYCKGVPEEWRIFQCGHPICLTCAELLDSRRNPKDCVCHVASCQKPIEKIIPLFTGYMV